MEFIVYFTISSFDNVLKLSEVESSMNTLSKIRFVSREGYWISFFSYSIFLVYLVCYRYSNALQFIAGTKMDGTVSSSENFLIS